MSADAPNNNPTNLNDLAAMDRACPIFTVALASTTTVMDPTGKSLNTVPCLGVRCAMFMPMANEQGEIVPGSGGCAFAAMVGTLSQAIPMVGQALNIFARRAKIAPASGIIA